MPASSQRTKKSLAEGSADHALKLLHEALRIIDDLEESYSIGARLSEVIDALKKRKQVPRVP